MDVVSDSSASSQSKQYHPLSSIDGSIGSGRLSSSTTIVVSRDADDEAMTTTMTMAMTTDHHHHNDDDDERQWAIKLFSLTTILLFADQNLMAPNLTAMAEEYGFDDEERDTKLGGHIALAFWILGAPAAICVGIMADQFNRSRLFAWTVGIGEGACFMTYFTKTYWQLYVCRALTGFSIGGALPLIYSILGDMFRADERHKVNAMVGMGTGLGVSVGQGISGFLGPTFGWRLPFLVVSIPALICAATVLFTVKDPERGGMERAVLERRRKRKQQQQQQQQQQTSSTTPSTDLDRSYGDYADTNNNNKTAATTPKELEMQCLTTTSSNHNNNATETLVPSSSSQMIHNHHQSDSLGSVGVRKRSREFCSSSKKRQPQDDEDDETELSSSSNNTFKGNKSLITVFLRHLDPAIKSTKLLLRTPTVVLALLQGIPGCVPWGIVNTYLNDFLAEDRGMSVEFATLTVLFFGVGTFLGLILGGAGGQYLYLVDRRYPALLAGSMSIFSCVPFWVLLNGVNNNSNIIFIASIALTAGTAAGITGPIIKATLQNVTLPHMRGQAFALFNTCDDFGRGLGPVFVAYLITSVGGRTPAFNLGTLAWVGCGVLNLLIFFTAEGDEQGAQATISATWDDQQQQYAEDLVC